MFTPLMTPHHIVKSRYNIIMLFPQYNHRLLQLCFNLVVHHLLLSSSGGKKKIIVVIDDDEMMKESRGEVCVSVSL
jgi:hypothetical protein